MCPTSNGSNFSTLIALEELTCELLHSTYNREPPQLGKEKKRDRVQEQIVNLKGAAKGVTFSDSVTFFVTCFAKLFLPDSFLQQGEMFWVGIRRFTLRNDQQN